MNSCNLINKDINTNFVRLDKIKDIKYLLVKVLPQEVLF